MELILTAMAGFMLGFGTACLMAIANNDCEDCPYKIYYIQSITEEENDNG